MIRFSYLAFAADVGCGSEFFEQYTKNRPSFHEMPSPSRWLSEQDWGKVTGDFETFEDDVVGFDAEALEISAIFGVLCNHRATIEAHFGIRGRHRFAND